MLINLRNALMAGKRLPYDAEVEYLQSSGTQWINTGVKKTSAMTIDCTFSLSATNTKAIFGARTSSTALDRIMLVAVGTNFRFDADMQRSFGTTDTASMFRFQYDGTNATITNLTTGTTSTSSTPIGDAGVLDISLFGVNTNGVVGLLMQGMMYAFKIWDNGILVRDYIPVRVGQVGYLYDRVSGKLFGNAGTGDFVVGQDVVPVEYIESHGTEWIATGVRRRTHRRHLEQLHH